ncbi:hypothetical protein GCK32_000067 [Trichostrongylus colubriformis]|uniref:Barrier-to-autointegration factor 1 n=1 Tax=Trichostrongylus colubriformis TaxID=6319 RepID=A0AAN8INF8_TRICO
MSNHVLHYFLPDTRLQKRSFESTRHYNSASFPPREASIRPVAKRPRPGMHPGRDLSPAERAWHTASDTEPCGLCSSIIGRFNFRSIQGFQLVLVMSTSVKHREFIGEPMAEKEVTAVAGIGPAYGAKLAEVGFDKAYILFGQFLLLKKDEDLFTEWLKDTAGVSARHAKSAYDCLNAWAEQYI